jgi:hypothetical protein
MRGPTDLLAASTLMLSGALLPWDYLSSLRPPLEFAFFALDDTVPWVVDVPLMVFRRRHEKVSSSRTRVTALDGARVEEEQQTSRTPPGQ